jgi:uncharacterized membrane protein
VSAFLEEPSVRLIFALAVFAVLLLIGGYVITRYRQNMRNPTLGANELLSNFRELNSEGQLSDEEFRTIKSMLAHEAKQELRDTGDSG